MIKKRLFKPYVPVLILLLSWMTFSVPSVYACSGGVGVTPDISVLLNRDVLIRGIVVENSGGNSIIRVERYLKGSGNEYILLNQQSPALYINKSIRNYDYGCNYSRTPLATVGTQAYFSLDSELNGTYTAEIDGMLRVLPVHRDENGRYVEYVHFNGENYTNANYDPNLVDFIRVSEEEFEARFAEIYGHSAVFPEIASEFENPYPRFRELFVTTESGQEYMMPVDRDSLIPIDREISDCGENCPIVSPDGGHFAIPFPDQESQYAIGYYPQSFEILEWYDGITFAPGSTNERTYIPPRIHAQQLLFSPDANYIMAWDNAILSVYTFNIEPFRSNYGYFPTLSLITELPLVTNSAITFDRLAGHGAWSANSNAIAYWDAEGLKWLDLTTMSEPELIEENIEYLFRHRMGANANQSNNVIYAPLLELSSTGRFVRYGFVDEWILYDNLSEQSYENALVSPDETGIVRIIITQMGVNVSTPLEYECTAPLSNCITPIALHSDHYLIEAHWSSDDIVILYSCQRGNYSSCEIVSHRLNDSSWLYTRSFDGDTTPTTIDFAYDTIYQQFAWASDEYNLYLDSSPFLNPINYSTTLDSPIVSIEWGEPLWYLED